MRLKIFVTNLVLIVLLAACGGNPSAPATALPATAVPTIARAATTVPPTGAPATPAPAPTSTRTPVPPTATIEATPLATANTPTATSVKGKFDADGRELYIECAGSGSPTIVLEPGEGSPGHDMQALQKKLAEMTTTCIYDRANLGQSDPAPRPRTAKEIVNELHALLAAAQVPAPYVLVGHSAGGFLVQLYARTFPEQVAGVVSMNAVPPASPWLEAVSRVFTAQELEQEKQYYQGGNDELLDYLTSSQQLADAAKPPDVPFELLLSTVIQCEGGDICVKSYPVYEQVMDGVAAEWPRGNVTRVVSGHVIYKDKVNDVIAAVKRVLGLP